MESMIVDFRASLLAIGRLQSLKIRESQKYVFEKVWLFDVKCGCHIKLPDMRTHLARVERGTVSQLLLLDVMGMSYLVCSLSADPRI